MSSRKVELWSAKRRLADRLTTWVTGTLAVLVLLFVPTPAFAADCETEGFGCVIPDGVNWGILSFLSGPLGVVFNVLAILVSLGAIFGIFGSTFKLRKAVNNGNKEDARQSMVALGVSIGLLVVFGTGLLFTWLPRIINNLNGEFS